MKNILYISSSILGDHSVSDELARDVLEQLEYRYPDTKVTTLNLAEKSLGHLGSEEFNSWTTAPENRTSDQAILAELSDGLIEQLKAQDILVLAVPMYNLGIPSTLKAWIDRVSRAGETFRYTAQGPRGLVSGVRAYVTFARGGQYLGTPLDSQTGYIKSIMGLMGITDVETFYAEGLNMGLREKSINEAKASIQNSIVTSLGGVHHEAA